MMTMKEIFEEALANLRSVATRQHELAVRYMGTAKGPEWNAKFSATKSKIRWLERMIELWEGR